MHKHLVLKDGCAVLIKRFEAQKMKRKIHSFQIEKIIVCIYHTAYNAEVGSLEACMAVNMKVNSILGSVVM
jgi:hypothetical protein